MDRTAAAGSLAKAEKWQDGRPEPSIWTGVKQHPEDQRPIESYRCGTCGFIESYAR